MLVFDRKLVRARRNRAAADFARHNALFDETACQLIERLEGIKQEFKSVLDLGAHNGHIAQHFTKCGIPLVIAADISEKMLRNVSAPSVAVDEELLPFAPNSFDLVISNLSLHWVNDVPSALAQIKNILKPGGLFLASLIGGNSLSELRACLMDAELAVSGGASPRLSPTIDMQTASGLLQRVGFSMPVTDEEKVTLTYTDAFALMRDLRGMGETNAHQQRLRHPTRRSIFSQAAELYQERFSTAHGHIAATFDVVFLHGIRG